MKCFLQVPSQVGAYTIMAQATLCCTHPTWCLSSSPMDWEPHEVWICLFTLCSHCLEELGTSH